MKENNIQIVRLLQEGKMTVNEKTIKRTAISVDGIPVSVWMVFAGIAKTHGLTLREALTEAVLLFIGKRG